MAVDAAHTGLVVAEAIGLQHQGDLVLIHPHPVAVPQAVRGQRNRPAFVVHTAAFIAELRGVSVEQLGEAVTRNAARVFGW